MFESRIDIAAAAPLALDDHLSPLHSMLSMLRSFAPAGSDFAAPQHAGERGVAHPLAARYAAANSITRRRFDALLKEAETMSAVGLRLIVSRDGRNDNGTIAAARFLGNATATLVRRLENLLPPQLA